MSAKSEIMRDIRNAMGESPDQGLVRRAYRQTPSLDKQARIELFIDRLRDYNATVYRTASQSEAIAEALHARAKKSLLIPPGFPNEWLPNGFVFSRDHALDYSTLDHSEGALTACTAAIALTGTIILSHAGHEGRRALSLIPDYHLCIVRVNQLVETVPEGIRALANCRNSPITTISGPSATADIEMIRVKGVHGPRTLDVIILEEL